VTDWAAAGWVAAAAAGDAVGLIAAAAVGPSCDGETESVMMHTPSGVRIGQRIELDCELDRIGGH
jgi:hypothetical protein